MGSDHACNSSTVRVRLVSGAGRIECANDHFSTIVTVGRQLFTRRGDLEAGDRRREREGFVLSLFNRRLSRTDHKVT